MTSTIMLLCPGKDGTSCGAELAEKAKFCSKCGYKVKSSQLKSISCPGIGEQACGENIDAGQKFCSLCGWKVDEKLFETNLICRKCRQKLKEDANFCPNCGSGISNSH